MWGARCGMSNEKAAQAREGLVDSLAGKAKEVAGAVSGKDHLVEEGQLQQTMVPTTPSALHGSTSTSRTGAFTARLSHR